MGDRSVGRFTWVIARVMLLSAALFAPDLYARGLWWQLHGDGVEAFLGGSIHLGDETMYPLPDRVMTAFDEADVLVVEIDILNTGTLTVLGQLFRQGIYRDGSTLEAHLQPQTWSLLQQALAELQLPELMFRWQKPWFAAVNLSLLAFHEAGYREDLGVDYFFLEAATSGKKTVLELETVEQQLGLFSELSSAEQELFLQRTLLDLQDASGYLEAIIGAWQEADAQVMASLIHQQFDGDSVSDQRLYDLFIGHRNIAMASAIQALLEEGLSPFVVVGAGHLVGPDSLVNLLREAGYQVRQMKP